MVLGFDPAFRTGAKLAVVDETGRCLPPMSSIQLLLQNQLRSSRLKDLSSLIKEFGVEIIAIGNGTASRESERPLSQSCFTDHHPGVRYVIVNESGASVYSASELARHEFPELTVENDRPSPLPVACKIR